MEIDEELNNLADMVIKEMHQANTCKKKKQRNKKSSKKLTHKKTHGKHLIKNTSVTKDKSNSNRKGFEDIIQHTSEKVNPTTSDIPEPVLSNPLTVKPTSKRSNKPRTKKGASPAVQLKRLSNGSIDLETPSSILVHTDLKGIISEATFEKLPLTHQYQLLKLLPEVDREVTQNNQLRLSSSCLSNEFFNSACLEWRLKLSEGEFTPKTKAKVKQQAKKMAKLDPWKKENFEMSWGDSLKKEYDKDCNQNPLTTPCLTDPLLKDKMDTTDNSATTTTKGAISKKRKNKNIDNTSISKNQEKKKQSPKRTRQSKELADFKGKGKKKQADKKKSDLKPDDVNNSKEEFLTTTPLPEEEVTNSSVAASNLPPTNDIHIRRTYNIPKTCKCELKGMTACITCGAYSHFPCTSNTGGQCLICAGQ
ncbi:uncharacterized protein TRIADDRAFT_57928 [Trichoplax adhaerens]|uniref:DEUBAD domain-containing protein n=1 Tax=Trichoplax adhaerens TaxID=10228 RepID=B3S252_TRIAD|nr:hypothetical protein TRIADDRAFT_57928 [Trichoplax adhaerens]EDV23372.1 hypothetical protein TRIADDRAFT_57928 [Trichoplax adhaerens]|eukprot:XP_002114282.1 hypothetical protein TRIADDRAFT_57928 [Trichoplax adhaerens]